MSRNLLRNNCHFCEGDVAPLEAAREPTPADLGAYFEVRSEMGIDLVAHAHCVDCEAKYLAWIGHGGSIYDLSFRSTFNDEPGPDDYPKYKIARQRVGPWKENKA